MATKNYKVQYQLPPGSHGVLVEVMESGTGVWTKPTTAPNPTMAQEFPLALTTGKTFYVKTTSQGPCAPAMTLSVVTVPMDGKCCPDGYTLAPDGSYCYKNEAVVPTIQQSNICLAPSVLYGNYSGNGTYVYPVGVDPSLPDGTQVQHLTTTYWQGLSSSQLGPMNREGVWVDSDCDGTKDALGSNTTLQFSYIIHSEVDGKVVYVGVGGDNTFRVELDGTLIAERTASGGSSNFQFWHVVPVTLRSGPNQFNFKATGDQSVNDAFAAVIYDNTEAQLAAATADTDLTLLFRTGAFRGGRIDLATCPANYSLDTSGGQGNYVCRRTLTSPFTIC